VAKKEVRDIEFVFFVTEGRRLTVSQH